MNTLSELLLLPDLRWIKDGDHVGYLYQDMYEQVEVLHAFIKTGIKQGRKVICIINQEAKQQLLNSLIDENHNNHDFCLSGQLVIEDLFSLPDQNADPIRAIQNAIKREIIKGKTHGFSSSMIAMDMSDLLSIPGEGANFSIVDEIIKPLLIENKHNALFLYSQQIIDSNILLNLLNNHPWFLIKGKVYRNHGYQLSPVTSTTNQYTSVSKSTETNIQAGELLFRSTFEESPIGMVLIDSDGRLQKANKAFLEMVGVSQSKDLQDNRLEDIFYITEDITKQLNQGETVRSEIIFNLNNRQINQTASGEDSGHLHLDATISPINHQKEGVASGYIIQIQDMTHRKHSEEKQEKNRQQLERIIAQRTKELAQTILDLEKEISKRQQIAAFLAESEQRYRALVDGSPAPILVVQDHKFIFCNQTAVKMLGFSSYDDLIGEPIFSVIDPTYHKIFSKSLHKNRGRIYNSPKIIKMHRSDGAIILFESVTVPIAYSEKSAHLMIGYDVTERINAEIALKQSEETSRTLINAVHEAFYLLNPDGTIITANDEGVQRFNKKPEMVVGAEIHSNLPAKAAKEHLIIMEKVIQSGKPINFESRHKRKILDNTIYPIFNEQKQVIRLALYSRDVSEKVRTENALKRHAQEMEALNRTFLEITTRMDLSTLLHLIVKRAATLLGESSGGLYLFQPDNHALELVVSYNQNRDYTGVCLKLGEGLSGKIAQTGQPLSITNYVDWEEKPGVYFDCTNRRVLGVPLKVADQVIGVINVSSFQKTNPYTQEEICLVSLFADQAAIAIENTRLMEAAQHELEERIQATQALKASLSEKEVMLREIHHRVKNNLNVIIALLDLQDDSSKTSNIKPLFNDLKSRVRTMALVHENLYQSADLGRVDFASYLRTLAEYLLATYATQLPIQTEIDIPPIPMSIDTAIPCGLIVNELVTNAIKYAFPVEGWMPKSNQEYCRIRIQLKEENDQLVLSVSDNGVGISPDINWQATNTLGLLLVSTLTNQLNGNIEKVNGVGTTFAIRFKRKL